MRTSLAKAHSPPRSRRKPLSPREATCAASPCLTCLKYALWKHHALTASIKLTIAQPCLCLLLACIYQHTEVPGL